MILEPLDTHTIADITVNEDDQNTVIDLSNLFTDINDDDDDDNAIFKTVSQNSNESLVTAIINDNNLILDYLPNQSGIAEITIQGESDDDDTAEDTFTVTVNPVDDPPIVNNSLDDVTVDEDANNTVIDLSNFVTDVDNEDSAIALRVLDNSNESLVTATINDNNLILDYLPNQSGTADITIQGESNGETVEDTFSVRVNPVDDPPVVQSALEDITVNEDANNTVIDLSNLLSDPDNEDSAITMRVLDNSNDSLVTATINDNNLILDYLPDQSGIAQITIQGESNGETVEDTFTVTVNSVDDSSLVKNSLDDVTVDEDANNTVIDLSNFVTDVDNEDSVIALRVLDNSNESLVTATINDNNLILDYLPNQSGTADITIQGESNGETVNKTFAVIVNPVDNSSSALSIPINRFQNSDVLGTYLYAGEAESQGIRENFPNFIEEGQAFKVSVEPDDDLIRLNRFQNSNVPGTYLYAGEAESQNIRENFPNFIEEGIAFYVYPSSADIGMDFYRFQNLDVPGTYLFVGGEEREYVLANFPNFIEEGVAFEVEV